MEKIDSILFDVGNVLIDTHTSVARDELRFNYGISLANFNELARSDFENPNRSVTELAVLGLIDQNEYLNAFVKSCENNVSYRQIRDNRISVIGAERVEMTELLKQLGKRYTTGVFTNTIGLHWEHILTNPRYSFYKHVEYIFASHIIGFAKPQIAGFKFVLAKLGKLGSNVLFIDDIEANVSAAQSAGMKAILFKSVGCLRAQLDDLGVLAK